MAFVVVYDACILHPAPLRDLLLRIAESRIVQAKWTEKILDETFASILERRPWARRALDLVQQQVRLRGRCASLSADHPREGDTVADKIRQDEKTQDWTLACRCP